MVTDGKGTLANATISRQADFTVTRQRSLQNKYHAHLFVAPTKNADRMEWLVEKATEIGVTSITMVKCERSERKNVNHERLVKMAVTAMKQSQQPWLPEIRPMIPLKDVVGYDQNFIAYIAHSSALLKNVAGPGKSYGLLIGPEGDFTDDELKFATTRGWLKVSLGPTRLRTETAALAGLVTLQILNLEP